MNDDADPVLVVPSAETLSEFLISSHADSPAVVEKMNTVDRDRVVCALDLYREASKKVAARFKQLSDERGPGYVITAADVQAVLCEANLKPS